MTNDEWLAARSKTVAALYERRGKCTFWPDFGGHRPPLQPNLEFLNGLRGPIPRTRQGWLLLRFLRLLLLDSAPRPAGEELSQKETKLTKHRSIDAAPENRST